MPKQRSQRRVNHSSSGVKTPLMPYAHCYGRLTHQFGLFLHRKVDVKWVKTHSSKKISNRKKQLRLLFKPQKVLRFRDILCLCNRSFSDFINFVKLRRKFSSLAGGKSLHNGRNLPTSRQVTPDRTHRVGVNRSNAVRRPPEIKRKQANILADQQLKADRLYELRRENKPDVLPILDIDDIRRRDRRLVSIIDGELVTPLPLPRGTIIPDEIKISRDPSLYTEENIRFEENRSKHHRMLAKEHDAFFHAMGAAYLLEEGKLPSGEFTFNVNKSWTEISGQGKPLVETMSHNDDPYLSDTEETGKKFQKGPEVVLPPVDELKKEPSFPAPWQDFLPPKHILQAWYYKRVLLVNNFRFPEDSIIWK